MRLLLLLLTCLSICVSSAHATTKVVCYGDSHTAGDGTTDYPSKLAALRPDLVIVNYGLGGDVTENYTRFAAMLAAESPNIVVLLLGTNDPVCYAGAPPPATCQSTIASPRRSAVNLARMAKAAVVAGASVILLTPLPTHCIAGAPCASDPTGIGARYLVRQSFTKQLTIEIHKLRKRAGVTVGELRDEWSIRNWDALTVEGLHPNSAGYDVVAAFVASLIP